MCWRVHKMAEIAKTRFPDGFEILDDNNEEGCICEFKYILKINGLDESQTLVEIYISDIDDGINWYCPVGDKEVNRNLLFEVMREFNDSKFLKLGPHPHSLGTILEGAVPNRDNDDDDSVRQLFNFMNAEVLVSILELVEILSNLDNADTT